MVADLLVKELYHLLVVCSSFILVGRGFGHEGVPCNLSVLDLYKGKSVKKKKNQVETFQQQLLNKIPCNSVAINVNVFV